MKVLILLAFLYVCRAAVIPSRFNSDGNNTKSGSLGKNFKVTNARLKWMEWKKLNLSSRMKLIEEETERLKNGHTSSTEITPISNESLDDSKKVADTINKFRSLNEQGIFGRRFWDDSVDNVTSEDIMPEVHENPQASLQNIQLSNVGSNFSAKRFADENGAELTEKSHVLEETDLRKDSNDLSEESEVSAAANVNEKIDSKINEFRKEINSENSKLDNSDLKPDVHTDTVNFVSNILETSKLENSEINVPDLENEILAEVDKNSNEEIGLNLLKENLTNGEQVWKTDTDVFHHSDSTDLSGVTILEVHQKWDSTANDSSLRNSESSVLPGKTDSEATVFVPITVFENISEGSSLRDQLRTNIAVTTETICGINNEDLTICGSNISSETMELKQPTELSLSELIENVRNISGILDSFNLTEPIGFEVVTDNISSVNMLSVDETKLMNDGSEIALFQDQSETGFEFMLDSETAKNILIREMLSTSGFLENEQGQVSVVDQAFASGTDIEEQFELGNIKLGNLPSEISESDPLQETFENASATGTDSSKVTVADFTAVAASESVLEPQPVPRECPREGFCLFWFFARDRCLDSKDCGKSGMCCKIGCSKTCVDV